MHGMLIRVCEEMNIDISVFMLYGAVCPMRVLEW